MNRFIQPVKLISECLNGKEIKWCFGGSLALLIHGVKVEPNDIDIVINVSDINKALKVVKPLGFNNAIFDQNNVNIVNKVKAVIDSVDTEIITFDISQNNIVYVNYEGQKLPVYPLEVELNFYKERQGKEEKVRLIEERMKELGNI